MDSFDARTVQPSQGVGGHPPGRFPFTITNTYVKENNAKTGAMLVVELTSDVGRIENRYNIWNQSPQAVEIAQKELSALCHAVNIYKISFPRLPDNSYDLPNAARELRGGRGMMEVAPQTDKQGQPNGYMEVKKVFDSAGNEPGKSGSAPQPQQAQNNNWSVNQQPQPSQPMTQQPQGGWGNSQQPSNPTPAANPAPQQWGNGGAAPQAQPQQGQPQGWSPGGAPAAGQTPPWGK